MAFLLKSGSLSIHRPSNLLDRYDFDIRSIEMRYQFQPDRPSGATPVVRSLRSRVLNRTLFNSLGDHEGMVQIHFRFQTHSIELNILKSIIELDFFNTHLIICWN